jgi:EpsI family protein
LKVVVETPINLPVPLSAFPSQVGNWVGKDLPIPATTREYMEKNFADDFFSRRYVNSADKTWVDVYVVYCSTRPGGILGHRPSVCYPAHGWLHESTETSQFTSRAGWQISCLIHRFHKPAPAYDQTVVLNFYILNGQITVNENDFSGLLGRRPNIAGDPARYVAQVQISSVLENSIRAAAQEMTDLILSFLPDQNGRVRAAGYVQSTNDNVKSPE